VGDDLQLKIQGLVSSGVLIKDFYVGDSQWRIEDTNGVYHSFTDVSLKDYVAFSEDYFLSAKETYLDDLKAEFFYDKTEQGYLKVGDTQAEKNPVSVTYTNKKNRTVTSSFDQFSNLISKNIAKVSFGDKLESVIYESGYIGRSYRQFSSEFSVSETQWNVGFEAAKIEQQVGQSQVPTFIDLDSAIEKIKAVSYQRSYSGGLSSKPIDPEQALNDINSSLGTHYTGVLIKNETQTNTVVDTRVYLANALTEGVKSITKNIFEEVRSIEEITATEQDDSIYLDKVSHGILLTGDGNDHVTINRRGQRLSGDRGLFIDLGTGNDYLIGGQKNDTIIGNDGSDWLDGSGGADRYLILGTQSGNDLVADSGAVSIDLETGWSKYKQWYYESAGISPNNGYGFEEQIFSGPRLADIPTYQLEDFSTLNALIDAGVVKKDTLEFLPGISIDDLNVSFGSHFDGQQGLFTTLNLSWNLDGVNPVSAIRIVLAKSQFFSIGKGEGEGGYEGEGGNQGFTQWVQDDWFAVEKNLGIGIEEFKFADGQVFRLGELLEYKQKLNSIPTTLNTLVGTDLNDELIGTDTNDVFLGGLGNDKLSGGNGSDLYLFSDGDGEDVIDDINGNDTDLDVVQFSGNIYSEETIISKVEDDLVFTFENSTDKLTLSNWFTTNQHVKQFVFSEDGLLSEQDIYGMTNTSPVTESVIDDAVVLKGDAGSNILVGGNNDDELSGKRGRDQLFGGEGNDILKGGRGRDQLFGGEGNDVLKGGRGRDQLTGGLGDDFLNGGRGKDTYYFAEGDGNDVIKDKWNHDQLIFDEGISTDELWFSREGKNLKIDILGSDDSITINKWFKKDRFHIEEIHLASGETLLDSQVQQLVDVMASFSVPVSGEASWSSDIKDQVEPVLAAVWQ